MDLPRFLLGAEPDEEEKRRIAQMLQRPTVMADGTGQTGTRTAEYGSGPKFEPEVSPRAPEDQKPAMPGFNPELVKAPQEEQPQPLPKFEAPAAVAPPKPVAPVFDDHGAPTGAVTGDGTELERRRAAVTAEENYKPENHNSRLAGVGLGAARGGRNGSVIGAIFGAINGAANPSADEDYAHNKRLGEDRQRYGSEAVREKFDTDQANTKFDNGLQMAKFIFDKNKEQNDLQAKERTEALANLKPYEKLDPANPTHAAAIARAKKAGFDIDPETWNSGNLQTAFDETTGTQIQRTRGADTWEESKDGKGQPITTKRTRQEKLPDSFYELDGQSDKTVHADAVARAGVKDFSKEAELDPAKKKLLMDSGMTDEDIRAGIQLGTIKLSELVKDSQKDEARRYEAAVAGAESGGLKRLSLYRQAVDQTLTSPATVKNEKGETVPTPIVSIARFQQEYKRFFEGYSELYKKDPKAAEAKRADFFATLRNFRLR